MPSDGPAPPFIDGVLSGAIDWASLGDHCDLVHSHMRRHDADGFIKLIDDLHVRKEALLRKKRYRQLSGKHDAYIPTASAMRLFNAMTKRFGEKNTKVEFITGGHVAAFIMHLSKFVDVIAEEMRI